MKIATVSLNQTWENKESNIERIQDLMLEVSPYCPDLVVFPEMTLTGFTMNTDVMAEDCASSRSIDFFSGIAQKYNTNIAFGIILNTRKKPTNDLLVVSSAGNVIARYEKIHPFSYSGETEHFSKGEKVVMLKIKEFSIGLTICYDLRFPELYQSLSKECSAIINIANWPAKRVSDWQLLLHARALENQCYMIGVNRTGVDGNGIDYVKSTAVIDPRGKDLTPVSVSDEIDIYDLNQDVVSSYRDSFPVKKDRRTDLYKEIL